MSYEFGKYAGGIPKDLVGNLRWRKALGVNAGGSPKVRGLVERMACDDPEFFFDGLLYIFNPWMAEGRDRPFILYPLQREALVEIFSAIGDHDLLIEKSREEGATYMCLGAFLHQWLFVDSTALMIASRKEDLVDKRGNPDTLFWKLDRMLQYLPKWLVPGESDVFRSHMHLENRRNGSVIDGEATTGDLGAGGRRIAILLDEFARVAEGEDVLASTADNTPCRIFNSTPQGLGNAFAMVRQSGKTRVFTLPWWKNPRKMLGLYYTDEGKPRSPWYDAEDARRSSRREMAQEVDIDYMASGAMFFDSDVLARLRSEAKSPFERGELTFSLDEERDWIGNASFREGVGKRRVRLWCKLNEYNRPYQGTNYAAGADIAVGHGSSNSVVSIADVGTGKRVVEFVTSDMSPHDFAHYVMALCYWVGGESGAAYLAWEATGPGLIFGKEVLRFNYPQIYWHRNVERPYANISDIPGWHATRASKAILLGDYRSALARGDFVNPCVESIDEAFTYVYEENGSINPSVTGEEAEARATHGDRVIADALANLGLSEQPKARGKPVKKERSPVILTDEQRAKIYSVDEAVKELIGGGKSQLRFDRQLKGVKFEYLEGARR